MIILKTPENKEVEFKISSTHEAKEFFDKEFHKLGEIVSAISKDGNKIVLKSDLGYEVIFDGPLTTGYVGAGSNGTVYILEKCGFELKDLIHTSTNFILEKRQR